MGKSEHESFSFTGKSNLRLLKKNTKEKSAKKRLREKNEKKSGKSEGEKKEKSHFWWKWMGFLRRCPKKTLQLENETKIITEQALERWNNVTVPAINIIEIPIEPGRKISKILIKPTESGIQAMIAQYGPPFPDPDAALRRQAEQQNTCRETLALRGAQINVAEERPKSEEKRSNLNSEILERDTGFGRKRSIKISEAAGSDGVSDDGKDQILETFKTISEPTWNDRKKIFQQQQLKDNINNLLEQFLCLEAEDVMDFTMNQTKLTEEANRKFQGSKTSTAGLRELSREVSPEILVNIKPFKEQLSEDFLSLNGSRVHMQQEEMTRNCWNPIRARKTVKPEEERRMEEGKDEEEGREGRISLSDRTDVGRVENTFRRVVETPPQTIAIIKKEGDRYEGGVSLQFKYNTLPKSPACTVWGVYTTYSSPRNKIEGAEEWKGVEEQMGGKKGNAQTDRESVYELLDNLDDTDHDLVFRKNISQFRKKIAVMPRADAAGGPMNAAQTQKPKPGRADEAKPRKREAIRFECAKPWEGERRRRRILENVCLLLCERELLGRTLAARTEVGTLGRPQTAREVREMVESGVAAAVEVEVPRRFEERVREVKVVRVEGAERGPWTPIGALVAVHGGDFCGRTCAADGARKPRRSSSDTLRFFPNSTTCYYVLPEYWFYGVERRHDMNLDDFKDGVTLSRKPLTKLRDAEKEKIERDSKRETKIEMELSEVVYEPSASVVQVLNSSSCEYGVIIYDSEPLSSSIRWEAEGNVGTKTPNLSSPAGEAQEPRGKSANAGNAHRNTESRSVPDVCFDGFQIIYNNSKDSLNDDEDDTTKVVCPRSPTAGKKLSFIFATGESESKMTNAVPCVRGKPAAPERFESGASRALPYKSNSWPKEHVAQTEFLPKEHRARRSLIFSRELEKDCQNVKKRRLSLDKGMEIGRKVSATAEKDRPFLQKNSTLGKETFRSLPFPEELKCLLEPEHKGVERKKFVLENGGTNVKKELFAAFNSLKELNAGKGEAKGGKGRMSLVIMLSRK